MIDDNSIREQAKAIQEQSHKRQTAPKETPREARYRAQREKSRTEDRRNPMTRG